MVSRPDAPPPAPLETFEAGGLAAVRRRPVDLAPDAVVVLLVHGAMDRAASFGRAMRRLGDLDVVAIDRRGYGGSVDAWPVGGTGGVRALDLHASDAARVLDDLGAVRAVVVGHSFGGTVALRLAERGDDRVRAVGAYESPLPDLGGGYDRVGGGAIEVASEHGAAAAAEHFYRRMVGEHTWQRLRDRERDARRAEGPALVAELEDLRVPGHSPDLSRVRVPVAVGLGGRSSERLRRSAEEMHEALRALGGARVERTEIATAGHGAHLTHPDEFAGWVREVVGLVDDGADGTDRLVTL